MCISFAVFVYTCMFYILIYIYIYIYIYTHYIHIPSIITHTLFTWICIYILAYEHIHTCPNICIHMYTLYIPKSQNWFIIYLIIWCYNVLYTLYYVLAHCPYHDQWLLKVWTLQWSTEGGLRGGTRRGMALIWPWSDGQFSWWIVVNEGGITLNDCYWCLTSVKYWCIG